MSAIVPAPEIFELPDYGVREERSFERTCQKVLNTTRGTAIEALDNMLLTIAKPKNVDFFIDSESAPLRIVPVVKARVPDGQGNIMERTWKAENFDTHSLYPEQEFAAIRMAFANVRIELLEALSVAMAAHDSERIAIVQKNAQLMRDMYRQLWESIKNRRP